MDIVFSYKVGNETKQGTAADFTTEKIGSATEITLLDNFTAPSDADIIISSNCTLDLAGKIITTKKQIVVDDGAALTLKDSGKDGQIINDIKPPATGFADNCKAAIQVGKDTGENSSFVMESGTIKAGDKGITIKGKAVAEVNDGIIIRVCW